MTKIKSPEEFSTIIKEFKRKNGQVLTNCFLMPDEIAKLTENGKLFVYDKDGWLLFLCDRDDYFSLFYYTNGYSSIAPVKEFISSISDKDIYTDIVSRQGRGDTLTPERLIKDGAAEKYKVYQRMQLSVKNSDFNDVKVILPEGYSFSKEYCNCKELFSLWKEALDEKSTPLPKEDELKKLLGEGALYTALDSQGNLAAVIVFAISGKQGLIQHVAVSPKHRRKGLAAALMKYCMLCAKEEELSFIRLWVDCENLSAIALYNRFSFVKDGMLCEQLYMKGI